MNTITVDYANIQFYREKLKNLKIKLDDYEAEHTYALMVKSQGSSSETMNETYESLAKTNQTMKQIVESTIQYLDLIQDKFVETDNLYSKAFSGHHEPLKGKVQTENRPYSNLTSTLNGEAQTENRPYSNLTSTLNGKVQTEK